MLTPAIRELCQDGGLGTLWGDPAGGAVSEAEEQELNAITLGPLVTNLGAHHRPGGFVETQIAEATPRAMAPLIQGGT